MIDPTLCVRCDLCLSRKHVVVGEGSLNADMVFIGEAPGHTEDKLGRPFVGRAGKLIDYYLNYYGWDRKDIYITNVIKCKTPRNRAPSPSEISKCKEYLIDELNTIKPRIIVLFGNTAIATITGYDNKVKKLAGKPFIYKNMLIIPMYHPSYMLRNKELIHIYEKHWKIIFAYFSKLVPNYEFKPLSNG